MRFNSSKFLKEIVKLEKGIARMEHQLKLAIKFAKDEKNDKRKSENQEGTQF